ncbi:hypothetical protein B0H11DRAFT_1943543 [Mycena galericulata]|nr:hypothetical protein B0H11DRAFT_1943543 [Mycena galericulata]
MAAASAWGAYMLHLEIGATEGAVSVASETRWEAAAGRSDRESSGNVPARTLPVGRVELLHAIEHLHLSEGSFCLSTWVSALDLAAALRENVMDSPSYHDLSSVVKPRWNSAPCPKDDPLSGYPVLVSEPLSVYWWPETNFCSGPRDISIAPLALTRRVLDTRTGDRRRRPPTLAFASVSHNIDATTCALDAEMPCRDQELCASQVQSFALANIPVTCIRELARIGGPGVRRPCTGTAQSSEQRWKQCACPPRSTPSNPTFRRMESRKQTGCFLSANEREKKLARRQNFESSFWARLEFRWEL